MRNPPSVFVDDTWRTDSKANHHSSHLEQWHRNCSSIQFDGLEIFHGWIVPCATCGASHCVSSRAPDHRARFDHALDLVRGLPDLRHDPDDPANHDFDFALIYIGIRKDFQRDLTFMNRSMSSSELFNCF